MKPMLSSLRVQALLLGVLPAVVLSLLLGSYLINARLVDFEEALQSRGQALANQLAADSFYGLFSGDTQSLEFIAWEFMANEDIAAIQIYDDLGNLVFSRHKEGPPGSNPSFQNYHYEATVKSIRSGINAKPNGHANSALENHYTIPLGRVRVSLQDDTLTSLKRDTVSNGIIVLLSGIALISVLALLMSNQIVRPILTLSNAFGRLRRGEFNTRVQQTSGGELGILERGFNEMASRVALTQEELLSEVAQTTSDLQTTMDALEERNIELDLARKNALKSSQAKSEFLASISHEIRTPMNGIIGFARLLGKTELNSTQADQLRAINDSAENLMSIINDVLDFSKLESGRIIYHAQPFRLRMMIKSLLKMFTPEAREKHLELIGMVYDDVPDHVVGDAMRVRQVLTNLVGNAIKFTAQGKVTLRVMLDGEPDSTDERLCFSIQDTGIGLQPECLENLFQAFTQADSSTQRVYGGTGLGLSISKRLVEDMNGTIGAESEPGKGSTFWFSLPLVVASESEVEPVYEPLSAHFTSRQLSKESNTTLKGLRVLVADDNEINLHLAESVLASHEARVWRAEDGFQALQQAASTVFDIILMDVHMPGMTGLEAAKQIRYGEGPNAATPIIAVTADALANNHRQVFDAGMDEVVIKPVDEQQLITTIKACIYGNPVSQRDVEEKSSPSPDRTKLAVRDEESALSNTGGNQQIADDLFSMLLDSAQENIRTINALFARHEWKPLWDEVHRFQGAAAVCGTPALHALLREMETAIRQENGPAFAGLVEDLNMEIDRLRATCS